MVEPSAGVRIDKWLWAARFFKTRALAQTAIEAGHVRLNGERCKCSRELHIHDRLTLLIQAMPWRVTVLGLSSRRGPASEARKLYVEDPDSVAERERLQQARPYLLDPASQIAGRPGKRDRRLLHRFNEH